MKWSSSVVTEGTGDAAAAQLVDELRAGLDGEDAHLILLFVTPDQAELLPDLARRLRAAFPDARLLGCTGRSVLAAGQEVEGGSALAGLAGHLPDVGVVPFRVTDALREAASADPETWRRQLDLIPEQQPVFLLLADPFSPGIDALLSTLDAAFPGLPKVGGLVSGGQQPGAHLLLLDEDLHRDGAVGVALYGDVTLRAVVAQGARPVGPTLEITDGEGNQIQELDGGEAATTLQGTWRGLDGPDQERFRRAPLIGVATPSGGALQPGDFLVRNILALDRENGRIVVGGPVRRGDQVRFFVRDRQASSEDLRAQLHRWRVSAQGPAPVAALLFSCLGRGQAYFGVPNHDSRLVAEAAGPIATAGFFCNGEIGPVHGRTVLHGYTASVALIGPRGWS